MDAKMRANVLIKYKPMIEEFKNAIAGNERKAQAKLASPPSFTTLRQVPSTSIPKLWK